MSARIMNPVTAKGYTTLSNVIMLRKDLSPTAKLVYAYLCNLVWRNERKGVDIEPSKETIAADLGVSENTVGAALTQLRKAPTCEGNEDENAPRLVRTRRRGLGLTNVYEIYDPELPGAGNQESAVQETQDEGLPTRGRSLQVKTEEIRPVEADASTSGGALTHPPKMMLVNGKNLPLDALAEVVPGTDLASKASRGRTTTALYGSQSVQGIVEQFWVECVREDEARGTNWCARCHAEPDVFAEALARAIRAKAALYPTKVKGMMTALSLQSYWLGLEQMDNLNGAGGLSAAQMAAFADV